MWFDGIGSTGFVVTFCTSKHLALRVVNNPVVPVDGTSASECFITDVAFPICQS